MTAIWFFDWLMAGVSVVCTFFLPILTAMLLLRWLFHQNELALFPGVLLLVFWLCVAYPAAKLFVDIVDHGVHNDR